jgi:hypothetical protein
VEADPPQVGGLEAADQPDAFGDADRTRAQGVSR